MGTTESILGYDDAPYDGATANTNRTRVPSRDLSEHSSSPSHRSVNVVRRPRPRAVTLKGLVLGLPSSGKRTLLKRLGGKDPFATRGNHADTEGEAPSGITVPYQPPAGATLWDRIQLQVDLTAPQPETVLDFYVILVNPRHGAKQVREYIVNSVIAEAVERARLNREAEDDDERDRSIHSQICICLLLNFRDLCDQEGNPERIQLHSLQKWAEMALSKHPGLLQGRVIVDCGVTSLRNCYGLNRLHHFIYRAYMLGKHLELEERLAQVNSALQKANETIPEQSYHEFLGTLKGAQAASNDQPSRTSTSRKPAVQQKPDKGRRRENQSRPQPTEDIARRGSPELVNEDSTPRVANKAGRRPIGGMSSTATRQFLPERPPAVDRKKILDDFFADDEDDETEHVKPLEVRAAKKELDSRAEDDDGGDDYFFDERGRIHEQLLDSDELSEKDDNPIQGSARVARDVVACPLLDQQNEQSTSVSPPASPTVSKRETLTTEVSLLASANEPDVETPGEGKDEDGWDEDLVLDSDSDESGAQDEHLPPLPASVEKAVGRNLQQHLEETGGDEMNRKLINVEERGHGERDAERDTEIVERKSKDDVASVDDGTAEKRRELPDDERRHPVHQDTHVSVESTSDLKEAVMSEDELGEEDKTPPVQDTGSNEDDNVEIDTVEQASGISLSSSAPKELRAATAETTPSSASRNGAVKSGLSAAALAAIAVAEQEAQAMLEEADQTDYPPKSTRKEKKKKDSDAKKKKKKRKKEKKRVAVPVDDSE